MAPEGKFCRFLTAHAGHDGRMTKQKHLKGEERRRVACDLARRHNQDGLSVRQIAAETGYTESRVRDLLWYVGVQMRPRSVSPDAETSL